MGKWKFRLSVQRKNHERKRWGFYPVRIPIKGGVSVFKVSIPLSALSSQQKTVLQLQPPDTSPSTPLLHSLLSANFSEEPSCPSGSCEYADSVWALLRMLTFNSNCTDTATVFMAKCVPPHSFFMQWTCGCLYLPSSKWTEETTGVCPSAIW